MQIGFQKIEKKNKIGKSMKGKEYRFIKEYRTEEYDQNKFTVVIKKFKGKKLIKVKEKVIKTDGPIQNMNTLLLYLRKQPELKIGWHLAAKVPNELDLTEFDLKLISIDEIIVPGGKFQAYHFKSVPDTFELVGPFHRLLLVVLFLL